MTCHFGPLAARAEMQDRRGRRRLAAGVTALGAAYGSPLPRPAEPRAAPRVWAGNYHAFYQLLKGPRERKAYGLDAAAEGFPSLARGGCLTVDAIDDEAEWGDQRRPAAASGRAPELILFL